MLCRLDKCFKRYDINLIYSFNLLMWPKHVLFCFLLFFFFFLPKLPTQVFSLVNFIFFFIFFLFLFLPLIWFFFCLDGFKDHPTNVGNDKLVKSIQWKNVFINWVMAMLIEQIFHFGKAEGWTFSNCAHTNVLKENVKSLSLIKHLTPKKRDTPLFFSFWLFTFYFLLFFFCENNEFHNLQENNWLKTLHFFFVHFRRHFLFLWGECMIWIKKLCACHYE